MDCKKEAGDIKKSEQLCDRFSLLSAENQAFVLGQAEGLKTAQDRLEKNCVENNRTSGRNFAK